MLSSQLWTLFGICFLSSTLIPFPSEAAVFYALKHATSPWLVVLIAGLGNSLGGSTNYIIGYFSRKASKKNYPNAEKLVMKYGYWSALFSWLPFIGDPLIVLLGFYRAPWLTTLLVMTFGKIARYAIILLFM